MLCLGQYAEPFRGLVGVNYFCFLFCTYFVIIISMEGCSGCPWCHLDGARKRRNIEVISLELARE